MRTKMSPIPSPTERPSPTLASRCCAEAAELDHAWSRAALSTNLRMWTAENYRLMLARTGTTSRSRIRTRPWLTGSWPFGVRRLTE